MPVRQHILLTALGVQGRPTYYSLNSKTTKANLAPIALLQLLTHESNPSQVYALCTKSVAKETWQSFADEIKPLTNEQPIPINIDDGGNELEITEILSQTAKSIPDNADLTLDITHGFRHFPFLFYALTLYLQSFKNVRIRDAFYGMVEGRGTENNPAPIINLRPLIELPQWFFALETLKQTGATRSLSQQFEKVATTIRQDSLKAGDEPFKKARNWENVSKRLENFGISYEAGLPLELGHSASNLTRLISNIEPTDAPIPLMREILDNLRKQADTFALKQKVSLTRGNWKTTLNADQPEIKRQFNLIETYFERNQIPLAVALLREWIVTLILHKRESENWLNPAARQPIEQKLGALVSAEKSPSTREHLQSEQRNWAIFWNNLTQLRNKLMHQGMRIEEVKIDKTEAENIQKLRDFAKKLLSTNETLPELGGGLGQLLISPQGGSPGVLFSALKATKPDACIIICSAESKNSIDKAMRQAGFSGQKLLLEMKDPFNGLDEIKDLVKTAKETLLKADTIAINLTGGTTMMGIAVLRLLEKAQKFQRPARRFALIDKRPPKEQQNDPFQFNPDNVRWLDSPKHDD